MRLFCLKIALLIGFLILGGVVFVVAQEDPFAKLTYPISELGGCTDKNVCEVYCSKAENMKACLNFAKIHNLLPEEEIETGQRMLALGTTKGPGGCSGPKACETYCDQITHIKECIIFAEKYNLIPADELREARKVIQAMDRGLVPPKCKGKKECDIYCSQSENMEECITFAKEAGLMPPEEFQDAEKVLEAIKKGAKPPNCAGKKKCDIYCSQPEHVEECMEFGIAAGFMPPEEIENARKTLKAIKQGVRPPNCRGREECDIYCSQSEHMEECMEFGIAAGFMPPEEIEGARAALKAIKQGIRPPNCSGKEACDAYCSQPEHMEECMTFAIAAGFMSSEDAERARKSGGKGPGGCTTKEECEAFCSQPENSQTCIDFSVKMGDISPQEAERMRQQGPTNQMPGGPPGNMVPGTTGPGGCTNPEECQKYCESNPEACKNFQIPTQPMPTSASMPGGGPGSTVMPPCEGIDCLQLPPSPGGGTAPSGDMQQGMQPAAPLPGGPALSPPPASTAPGASGEMQPGEYVPPAPPSGEITPPPPSTEQPTSFLGSLLGLIFYPFKLLLR